MEQPVTTQSDFPELKSAFLRGLLFALQKRSKAIGHFRILQIESEVVGGVEFLTLRLKSRTFPNVTVNIDENHAVSIVIQGSRKPNKGRILARVSNLIVIDNAERFVSAFEWTALQSHFMEVGDGRQRAVRESELQRKWQGLILRVVDDM